MQGKVELSGVNTSKLKVLKNEETMALLRRTKEGDQEARRQLIEGNLRLVLSVIQRFSSRGENVDDLFQVGCVGLIKSIDNFDTSLNVRFSTYAVPMIIGEIRRFLRDCSPLRVSRSVRDTAYHALQARQQIEYETGDAASLEDIAAALNLPVSDVVYALDGISDPVSLYEPVYHDGDDTVLVMDQLADDVDENRLSKIDIDDAVENLGERERKILMMRFYDGKTQMEVSKEIGISQAQVSRLEKTAIAAIHNKVAN